VFVLSYTNILSYIKEIKGHNFGIASVLFILNTLLVSKQV